MSVYESLTKDPNRRNRPETLLRLLSSSSYPHASITNLTFAMAHHGRLEEPAELEQIAITMQEVEKAFTMVDFIRSIEIKRKGKDLTIIAKVLDFDPTARGFIDSSETHVPVATSFLTLSSYKDILNDPTGLATKIIELFYKNQTHAQYKKLPISKTKWKYVHKPKDVAGTTTQIFDYSAAVDLITISLLKTNFHLILTQSAILLADQHSRLHFGNRS